MDIHKKETYHSSDWNNVGSYHTLPITNCINSNNHEINCKCIICQSCRDDVIEYYKNKKKKIIKRKILSKSVDRFERSQPININTHNTHNTHINNNQNYMSFNSLPNMYNDKFYIKKNIVIDNIECLLCNKSNNNKLVNHFYFLCEECYISNELL